MTGLTHVKRWIPVAVLCIVGAGVYAVLAEASSAQEARALFRQGNAAQNAKDYPRAIKLFSQSIELDPTYSETWNNRGAAHQNRGDFAEAYDDYSQALKLDPRHPRAWLNRASVAWRLDRLDQAWSDLDQAEKVGGYSQAKIYATRSYVCLMRGEIARSHQWLWDGVQADPSKAWIQEALIKNLSKMVSSRMLAGAEARIAKNPNDKYAHYDRGYILMQSGKSKQGMAAFQRALKIDPRFALVYLQMGYYLTMSFDDDAAAIGMCNKAITFDLGGYAGTLARWLRARASHGLNHDRMAAGDAAAVLRKLPKAYQVLAEVARAEYRAGRHNSAVRYLDQALTARPGDSWAINFRTRILQELMGEDDE